MANKTIPQLPEQTGKTDNDLLAIVDSGETTTSKIKVSTLLAGVGGETFFSGDTTEPSNVVQKDRGHSITYGTGAIEDNFFLGGSNNTIDASIGTAQPYYRNVLLGGLDNEIKPDFSNASWSTNNTAVIAGTLNRMGRQSDNSVMMGGRSNYIGYGEDNVIIGGNNNNVSGGGSVNIGGDANSVSSSDSANIGGFSNIARGNRTGTFVGNNNEVQINCQNSVALGGINNSMGATGYDNSAFVGGNGNTISGDNSVIAGGQSNNLSNQYSIILGGQNNSVSGAWSAVIGGLQCNNAGKDSTILSSEFADITGNATIIGGWGSYVYSNTPNPENGAFSFYSPGSYVRQTNGSGTGAIKGNLQGLIASKTCEINGQTGNETTRSLIIASNDTDITGGTTNTLMLGCSGRTGVNSYTTYVETLEAFTHVVLNDYSNLNFASDSAAATGGVPLGGVYHNAGDLKVRIT